MKIALIGYGKMGKMIHALAQERSHTIHHIIDLNNKEEIAQLENADIAIEFTNPESAVPNFTACFEQGIPVVSGTTGWLDKWDTVVKACKKHNTAFFYAPNFSLGVNILMHINKMLAEIMHGYPQYKAEISETHHVHKKDAPSGTAIKLAEDIIHSAEHLHNWHLLPGQKADSLPIEAHREGEINGIHTIAWDSDVDTISIRHEAKNRKGFALGSILAAEFILDKQGIFNMNDLLKL